MRIVVIGSGIAGVSFAEEMRKRAPETELTLLTRETGGYYSRPLLSHAFTRDDIESKIVLRDFEALAQASGIRVISGVEVRTIEPDTQNVIYRQGEEDIRLAYDKLVLALGSDALIPAPFQAQTGLFHVLNSLDDLKSLRRLRAEIRQTAEQARWAVIGGGLIGCEVSADLAGAGDRVTLFHALPRLMERQLVEDDSAELLRVLREDFAIDVRLDCGVQGFEGRSGDLAVRLGDHVEGGFHVLIVACGFKPRIELAQAAGLKTGRGIKVDAGLLTSNPHIHAIGDAAELPDGKLYAYVTPTRSQALWLAAHLAGGAEATWQAPMFKPKAKVPGFSAAHAYLF